MEDWNEVTNTRSITEIDGLRNRRLLTHCRLRFEKYPRLPVFTSVEYDGLTYM